MKTSQSMSRMALLTALYGFAFAPAAFAQSEAAKPAKAAQQCLTDLSTFDAQLQKEGYWFHGSGYGYGIPVYGYAYSYGAAATHAGNMPPSGAYADVRPGYEVRTLLASANILAQRGNAPGCEGALKSAHDIYSGYAARLRDGKVMRVDVSSWRHQQIDAAVPVTGADTAYRSDELVGAEVVDPQGGDLGSVEDLVMSPKTGELGYLVVSRGGMFGLDKTYVPVPWQDFKAAPGGKLLVLATVKATMEAAPQVKKNQDFQNGDFTAESSKVNAYWLAHLVPTVAVTGTSK